MQEKKIKKKLQVFLLVNNNIISKIRDEFDKLNYLVSDENPTNKVKEKKIKKKAGLFNFINTIISKL